MVLGGFLPSSLTYVRRAFCQSTPSLRSCEQQMSLINNRIIHQIRENAASYVLRYLARASSKEYEVLYRDLAVKVYYYPPENTQMARTLTISAHRDPDTHRYFAEVIWKGEEGERVVQRRTFSQTRLIATNSRLLRLLPLFAGLTITSDRPSATRQ
jgi:hypothetical protein